MMGLQLTNMIQDATQAITPVFHPVKKQDFYDIQTTLMEPSNFNGFQLEPTVCGFVDMFDILITKGAIPSHEYPTEDIYQNTCGGSINAITGNHDFTSMMCISERTVQGFLRHESKAESIIAHELGHLILGQVVFNDGDSAYNCNHLSSGSSIYDSDRYVLDIMHGHVMRDEILASYLGHLFVGYDTALQTWSFTGHTTMLDQMVVRNHINSFKRLHMEYPELFIEPILDLHEIVTFT